MWPGPTMEVRKGEVLRVKWTNNLPTKHFLPVDTAIHGSEESMPQVRTVVHVHGARTLPESDGSGKDTSALPDHLVPIAPMNAAAAVRERILELTEMDRPSDGYTVIGLLRQKHWDHPITEDPKAGAVEIWSFANTTGDVHPIHTHLVRFQVLNRQPFNTKVFLQTGKLVYTGIPMPPETNERPAWKDTIKTYPGYVTRVIQKFDLPEGTRAAPGQEFRYVWHCHILEHEDNEMMRPYKIVG
jgi:spore coat protein A, manganese oxidase